jgi:hypothetical protein
LFSKLNFNILLLSTKRRKKGEKKKNSFSKTLLRLRAKVSPTDGLFPRVCRSQKRLLLYFEHKHHFHQKGREVEEEENKL